MSNVQKLIDENNQLRQEIAQLRKDSTCGLIEQLVKVTDEYASAHGDVPSTREIVYKMARGNWGIPSTLYGILRVIICHWAHVEYGTTNWFSKLQLILIEMDELERTSNE